MHLCCKFTKKCEFAVYCTTKIWTISLIYWCFCMKRPVSGLINEGFHDIFFYSEFYSLLSVGFSIVLTVSHLIEQCAIKV